MEQPVAGKTRSPATPIEDLDKEELLALARLNIERGDLEAALIKLKRVLADASPPEEALAMGGRLYAQLGLPERAKDLFQRYIDKRPGAVNETFQLGMVHFDSGEAAQAKKIWEGVLKAAPAHPPALFHYGLLLAQQGHILQARQSLEALLQGVP